MKLILGGIKEVAPELSFDLIILSHVLEHTEPVEFLKEVSMRLSPEGSIYVEVPSLDSVAKGAYEFDLKRYWQNAHLIHFSKLHLSAVAMAAGLQVGASNNYTQAILKRHSGATPLPNFEKTLQASEGLLRKIASRRKSTITLIPVMRLMTIAINFLGLNDKVRRLLFPRQST